MTSSRSPRERVFHAIYTSNAWGNHESISGPGSTLERTSAFRQELLPVLDAFGVKTLLDAPCGDFNWMRELSLNVERYVGVDIVTELVEHNQRQYADPSRTFLRLDLISDPLPCADAILCRDGLVHFSFDDIAAALRNFMRTGAACLIATTFPRVDLNVDIPTGDWRWINMERPPFNFPPPAMTIDEKRRDAHGTDIGKFLGVWRFAEIAPEIG